MQRACKHTALHNAGWASASSLQETKPCCRPSFVALTLNALCIVAAEGIGPTVRPILEPLPKWSLVHEIMEVLLYALPLHYPLDEYRQGVARLSQR